MVLVQIRFTDLTYKQIEIDSYSDLLTMYKSNEIISIHTLETWKAR